MYWIIFSCFIIEILYIILLLLGMAGLGKLDRTDQTDEFPFVSVLIPAHNSAKTLPVLIQCLASQTYPEDRREIIFINDRSTDETAELCFNASECIKRARVITVTSAAPGVSPKKNALLQGITDAKGPVILTTDSDTMLPDTWIESMARCFTGHVSMVLGYAPYRTDGPFSGLFHKILALEYFSLGAVAAASCALGFPLTCNGANLAFRKKDFLTIGGYGKSITILSGDDDLLLHRFRKYKTGRITFNASTDCAVKNDPPANIRSFISQRLRFSSKHLAYPPGALAVMGVVYMFHVLLMTLLVSTVFHPGLLIYSIAFFGIKSSAEFLFLLKAQKKLETRNLLVFYGLTCIPYLFYIVFIPVCAQIVREKW